MKTKSIHIVLFCLLLIISSYSSRAGVTIPDPNFRQFLINTHPSVMNGDQTLNTIAAAALNTPFKCINKNITNLSGIEYFTSITTLEVQKNPGLQSIPNIDGLVNITILGLDSNDLTSLPNLSTLVNLEILSFHHNRIQSIPSISSLTQLQNMLVYNNELTTLPDLSNQVNLLQLMCSDNPLTSLPSFSTLGKLSLLLCQRTNLTTLPDLSACVLLEFLICTNNNMTSVPSLSTCTILKELKVFRCKLTSLPNLSGLPMLTVVNAHNNELSFEDIQPLTAFPFFAGSTFNNQSPGLTNTINAVQLSTTNISLGFDNAVSNSVYTWYKDGIFVTNTSQNNITLNPVQFTDDGVYTCTITNTTPALVGITLNTQPITLRVSPCVISNNIEYSIMNTDCSYPIQVQIDESSFTSGYTPFSYVVKNSKENKTFNTPSITLNNEGTYDLIVTDARGCEVNFASKLVIHRHEQCDAVFYPNGDGIADTYYIENRGNAKIYDRTGSLIKEIRVPNNWDGTNSKGEPVKSGLYLIVVNESNSYRVTVIR